MPVQIMPEGRVKFYSAALLSPLRLLHLSKSGYIFSGLLNEKTEFTACAVNSVFSCIFLYKDQPVLPAGLPGKATLPQSSKSLFRICCLLFKNREVT